MDRETGKVLPGGLSAMIKAYAVTCTRYMSHDSVEAEIAWATTEIEPLVVQLTKSMCRLMPEAQLCGRTLIGPHKASHTRSCTLNVFEYTY